MSSVTAERQRLRNLFKPYGAVSEKMLEYLESYSGLSTGKLSKQVELFFKQVSNPAEYLDQNGSPTSEEGAYYIWVSTGIEAPASAAKYGDIYVAFAKDKKELKDAYDPEYFCYYISTRSNLEKNINEFRTTSGKIESSQATLLSNIYNMLLIKSDWAKLPNYRILSELLRLSEAKIANDENQGCSGKNCVYNKTRTKLAYNPGLISSYGNDIIIIANLDENGNIVDRKIAQSKTQLKNEGFEVVEIPPVSFYQSRRDLVFEATAEDFDLDDFDRIRHIIEHRRERFPEKAKDLPDDELFNKIRASLEFDLKMTARNPYWAAPFYNIKQDEIQYLLPLFMGSFSEEPDLALVVGKGEHYYEARTVLSLNMAYANAACLASPPSAWLRNETGIA